MWFLLSQMLFLLLLSALFGAWLMYLWLGSRYEEVTETWEYWNSRNDDLNSRIDGLHAKMGSVGGAAIDLGPVEQRLAGLDGRISSLSTHVTGLRNPDLSGIESGIARLGTPGDVDLNPILARLEALEGRVYTKLDTMDGKLGGSDMTGVTSSIAALSSTVGAMRSPDLEPVHNRLAAIESKLGGNVDLGALHTRFDALEGKLGGDVDLGPLHHHLDAIEGKLGGSVDLTPVQSRLDAIEGKLGGNVDLSPVHNRLDAIDSKLGGSSLDPVHTRLTAIESKLGGEVDLVPVRTHLTQVERKVEAIHCEPTDLSEVIARLDALKGDLVAKPNPMNEARRHADRNLLLRPAFGAPDDLKVISGVGPKLEKMLHGIGVYYFWQVSDWSLDDVNFVDDQLEVFKGRIERDEWVTQAKGLAAQPGSAARP